MINLIGEKIFNREHPDLLSKLKHYENLHYLPIIDRTFYLIHLREEIYTRFTTIIGEDSNEEIREFVVDENSFTNSLDLKSEEECLKAYISGINAQCIALIKDNLDSIKYLFQIADYDTIVKRPYPSIIKDYNKLLISLFIFPRDIWWKLILLDIEKLYGEKRKVKKAMHDDVLQIKRQMIALPAELKYRIGTSDIKIYHGNNIYINISTELLDFALRKLPINEKIGNLNFDDKLIVLEAMEEDRKALMFHHSTGETYEILQCYLSQYMGISPKEFKISLKKFIKKHTIPLSELGQYTNELRDVQLNFIDKDNIEDFYGFLKFMKEVGIIKPKGLQQNKCAKRFPTFTNCDLAPSTLTSKKFKNSLSTKIKSEFLKYAPFVKLLPKTQ